ncbi:kin of IRRE-like protein 2 isoform X2 [Ciona intestinalis]
MGKNWLIPALLACLTVKVLCASMDPVIVEDPADVTVRQGDDVTLRCVVEMLASDEERPVLWMKDGFALGYERDLPNWGRYSMVGDVSIGEYNLLIRNVSAMEDECGYQCQVTKHRLGSKTARVTVQVPPTGPEIDNLVDMRMNVIANRENEISCRAFGGKPAALLHWYRNGIEISDGVTNDVTGPVAMVFNTTSTLRITPRPDDVDATYACVMTSDVLSADEAGRKMMRFNILEPPVVTATLPDAVHEHDIVTAECLAEADPPVTSYKWYINGELQSGETLQKFHLGTVDRASHRTTISCVATNEAGDSDRSDVALEVLYAPVFINGTEEMTSEVGGNVTLRCEWESNPAPSVRWLRNGEVVGSGQQLQLYHVTQSDSGSYTCYADAENVGDAKMTSRLTVRGPPIFDSSDTQYVNMGEEGVVNCALWSRPGMQTVKWTWSVKGVSYTLLGNASVTSHGTVASDVTSDDVKYRGIFKTGDTFARLSIAKMRKEDLVSYTCTATNSYGESALLITLEEDTSGADDVMMLGIAIGGAIGGVFLIIIFIVIMIHCARSRSQQKSTNFDKEDQSTSESPIVRQNTRVSEKAYNRDETIPINHTEQMGQYNVRSSLSSHGGAPGSSVTESDDTNPTPTSGQDDGYHTEANSWNRGENPAKLSMTSSSPAKSPATVNSYNAYPQPFTTGVPPPQQAYSNDLGPRYATISYQDYPARTQSPGRYAFDQGPYDPTTLSQPVSVSGLRSASAMGERLSPPPVRYVQRKFSDVTAPLVNPYSMAPTSGDFYPAAVPYTNMYSYVDSTPTFAPSVGGNRTTPIPASITGSDRNYGVPATGSSQSSLDKYERGSALSATPMALRPDIYENSTRMSNLSSRMSQSSRSSDFIRPLTARMATHV